VGIEEATTAQVLVSPNPAKDVLVISDARWIKATVHDMGGRMVATEPMKAGRLDIANLPVGMYILHLTDNTGATGVARFEKR
ncbi:MAG TPA: T9SS type A sorting domain-containing protein, partial [Flavobacteriales bacterium]|nr:T9SS type A sorting domain-containing protein [Flavobacteriales bacterium]